MKGNDFHSMQPFTIPIWIDTLCIPVQPKLKEYRKLAIQRLHPIFYEADKVLVLDEELQAATSQCTKYEKCLRILLSAWMRRLWTLQEATMGYKKLFFQFREQAIPLSSLKEELSRMVATIQYRTTSNAADEALCIATLAGVGTEDIIQFSSAGQRMKKLLIELRQMSSSIVFMASPKLDEENFTWAPCSFLSIDVTAGMIMRVDKDLKNAAFCDNEGLHATYPGSFLLPNADSVDATRGRLFVKSSNDLWWYYSEAQPEVNILLELQKITTPAIIYWQNVDSWAVILSIKRDINEVLYARYAFAIKRVPWKDSFGKADKPSFMLKIYLVTRNGVYNK
ncbi:hypothetical protein GGI43DRAFT_322641 [Trichoderma evansii]